jgi:hypothetical protein
MQNNNLAQVKVENREYRIRSKECLAKTVKLVGIVGVLLLCTLPGAAQEYDSAFYAQHSIHRSDTALIADTIIFPNDSFAENYEYS